MEKGSIAICFVEQALQSVRKNGLDAETLLRSAGISPALLGVPQARVSPANYSALWRLIAQALDDEFFGQDARRMKVGTFAMLCQSVLHCDTLDTALRRALRFFDLVLDELSGTLASDGTSATITLQQRGPQQAPRIFAHETMLIMLHGLACWLVGRRIPISSVAFAYPEPEYSAEYRSMYSSQLRFCAPQTVLSFNASYLALPVIQNQRTVKDFLRIAPENVVLKYKNNNSIAARLRRRLRALPVAQWPDFDVLADEVHMTRSTLRRRLDEEGQSYQSLKDQLRRDLAIDFLCHSSRSVTDIALELGFAEPSAFHRAFKKWTGARPAEYRQRMPPQDGGT